MKKSSVIKWFLSFGFALAGVVYYGLYYRLHEERLCFVCIVLLAIFAILFTRYNKEITLEGGYTSVQALFFYIKCKKTNVDAIKDKYERNKTILDCSKNLEWSKDMDEGAILRVYKDGKKLYNEFKKK